MSSQAENWKLGTEHGVVQERDVRSSSMADMDDVKEIVPSSVGDTPQTCSQETSGNKTSQIDVTATVLRTRECNLKADCQGKGRDDQIGDAEVTSPSSLPFVGGEQAGVVIHVDVADSTDGCTSLNTPETHCEGRPCKLRRTSGEMKVFKSSNRAAYQEVALAEADCPKIVGRRIKVYWPLDKVWYRGEVKGYQPSRKMHKIVYDDSDEEWLKLGEEKCKLQVYPGDMFGVGAMWPEDEHEEVAGSDGITRLEVGQEGQEISNLQGQPLDTTSSGVEVGCIERPLVGLMEKPALVEGGQDELGVESGVATGGDDWEHAMKAVIGEHVLCNSHFEGGEFLQRPLGMRVEVNCDVRPSQEDGLTAPAWEPVGGTMPIKMPEVALNGRGMARRILEPSKGGHFGQYHIGGGVDIFCVSTGRAGVEKVHVPECISPNERMEMSVLLGDGRTPVHVAALDEGGGQAEIGAGEVHTLPAAAGPSPANVHQEGLAVDATRETSAGCLAEDPVMAHRMPRVVDRVERGCEGVAGGMTKGRRTNKGPKRAGELSGGESPEVIELDKDEGTAGDRETDSHRTCESPSWMPEDGMGPSGAPGPQKVNVLKLRRCPTNGGQWTVASGSMGAQADVGMLRAGMDADGQAVGTGGVGGAEIGISMQWRSRQSTALPSGGTADGPGLLPGDSNLVGESFRMVNADTRSAGEGDLRFGYGTGKGHARSQKRSGGRPGPIDVDVAVAVEPKGEVVAGQVDVKEARRRRKKAFTPDAEDPVERSTSGRGDKSGGRGEAGRREQREGSGSPWERGTCSAKLVIAQDDQGKQELRAIVDVRDVGDNTWVLAVSLSGDVRYRFKPDQPNAVGGLNRYNHTMVWKGPEKERWSLEFDDRREWSRFKDLYEECVQRNIRAAAIRHIPIPGVVEVPDYYKRNHPKFVRPAKSYIKRSEGEAELALANTRVVYDMDSEDEQWLQSKHAEGKTMITEDVLERIMDRLEKDSFTLQEPVSLEVAEELLEDLAPRDVVSAIHGHWYERRMRKKMALVRHFQPPSWVLYHLQVQEMEQQQKGRQQQEAEGVSLTNAGDKLVLENQLTPGVSSKPFSGQYATLQPGSSRRPPLFAFCLRPRGMEGLNKLHKQKTQQKKLDKVLSSPRAPLEAWGTPVSSSTPTTPITLGAEARSALAAGMIAERQDSRKRKAELKASEGLKKVLPKPQREFPPSSMTRHVAETPQPERRKTFESPRQRTRVLVTSQEPSVPSPPPTVPSEPTPPPTEPLPRRVVKISQKGCEMGVNIQHRPSPLSLPTPTLTPVASPMVEQPAAKTPRPPKGSWKVKGKKSRRLRLAVAGAAGAAARKRKAAEASSLQPSEGDDAKAKEGKAPRHSSITAVLVEQVVKPTRHSPRGEPGLVVVDPEAEAAEKAAAAKIARRIATERRMRAQVLYGLADAALCRAVSALVAAEAAQAADAAMEAAMTANPGVLTGTGLTPRAYSRGWGGVFATGGGSRPTQVAVTVQGGADASRGKKRGKGKKGLRSAVGNRAADFKRKLKSPKKTTKGGSVGDTEAPPLVAADGSQLSNGGGSEEVALLPVASWSEELGAGLGTQLLQKEQPQRLPRMSPVMLPQAGSPHGSANGLGPAKRNTVYPVLTAGRTRGETRHAGS